MPPRSVKKKNSSSKLTRKTSGNNSTAKALLTGSSQAGAATQCKWEHQLLQALAGDEATKAEALLPDLSLEESDIDMELTNAAYELSKTTSSTTLAMLSPTQRAREVLIAALQSQLRHEQAQLEEVVSNSNNSEASDFTKSMDEHLRGTLRQLNSLNTQSLFRRHLLTPSDKRPQSDASSAPSAHSVLAAQLMRGTKTTRLSASSSFIRKSPMLGMPHGQSTFAPSLVADFVRNATVGFGSCKVRALAWQMLLGGPGTDPSVPSLDELLPIELSILREKADSDIITQASAQELLLGKVTGAMPSLVPEQVVYNDIERSLWVLYADEEERLAKRKELKECLYRILLASSRGKEERYYHYYQGLHEMLGHILYVMGSGGVKYEPTVVTCNEAVRRCFAPMCAPSLMHSEAMLRAMHFLIIKEDPQLAELLEKYTLGPSSHYGVSWLLTWFSHEIDDQGTLYFVFDLLFCMSEAAQQETAHIPQRPDKEPTANNVIGMRRRGAPPPKRNPFDPPSSTQAPLTRQSADEIIYWCAALMLLFREYIIAEDRRIFIEERGLCGEEGDEGEDDAGEATNVSSSMHFGMLYSIIAKLPHRLHASPMGLREAFLKGSHQGPFAKDRFCVYELLERVCKLRDSYPTLAPFVSVCEKHMAANVKTAPATKEAHGNEWDAHGRLVHRDPVTAELEALLGTHDIDGSAKVMSKVQRAAWISASVAAALAVGYAAKQYTNQGGDSFPVTAVSDLLANLYK